jgi:hypothetical protein
VAVHVIQGQELAVAECPSLLPRFYAVDTVNILRSSPSTCLGLHKDIILILGRFDNRNLLVLKIDALQYGYKLIISAGYMRIALKSPYGQCIFLPPMYLQLLIVEGEELLLVWGWGSAASPGWLAR